MDRRRFLKFIPAATAAAAVLPQACVALAEAKPATESGRAAPSKGPRVIDGWIIDPTGSVSLHDGQSLFPVYDMTGGLSLGLLSLHLQGDVLIESRGHGIRRNTVMQAPRGKMGLSHFDAVDLGRGTSKQFEIRRIAKVVRGSDGLEHFIAVD